MFMKHPGNPEHPGIARLFLPPGHEPLRALEEPSTLQPLGASEAKLLTPTGPKKRVFLVPLPWKM